MNLSFLKKDVWAPKKARERPDILRLNQGNIKEMSIAVISELVKFTNANQGGMFVFNDDEGGELIEWNTGGETLDPLETLTGTLTLKYIVPFANGVDLIVYFINELGETELCPNISTFNLNQAENARHARRCD